MAKTELSGSDEWSTPQDLFDELNKKYKFIADLAASKENAKCAQYFTKEDNALLREWPVGGWNWLNPPYSKPNLGLFMPYARAMAEKGRKTVVLVPASTSERWFQDAFFRGVDVIGTDTVMFGCAPGYILRMEGTNHKCELRFVRGRFGFDHGDDKVSGSKKGSVLASFCPRGLSGEV